MRTTLRIKERPPIWGPNQLLLFLLFLGLEALYNLGINLLVLSHSLWLLLSSVRFVLLFKFLALVFI